MKFLAIPFTLISVALATPLQAQDAITLTDGNIIEAKVTEISESKISYYKKDAMTGPLYSISPSKIASIKFENGKVETFNNNAVLLTDEFLAISDKDPKSLLKKGNRVFVEIPDEASRAGEKYFIMGLKDWGYWDVVDKKEEAHFIIVFNIDKKPMLDKSSWVEFKNRSGKQFLESKHYRTTTNAWNGYNSFKGAAERVLDKYLKEEYK